VRTTAALLLFVCAGSGCVSATGARSGETRSAEAPAAVAALPPAGFGTLRQDDISMFLRSGELEIRVTPLDEATIRLLAPDTYARLHAVRTAHAGGTHADELFLVSFHSRAADVAFEPEDLHLLHRSRLLRPAAIHAVTAGWGRQRLSQQETQVAVYAFEGPMDYGQDIGVRLGAVHSDDWRRILVRLAQERARVSARSH
jgi:hypothetical protein